MKLHGSFRSHSPSEYSKNTFNLKKNSQTNDLHDSNSWNKLPEVHKKLQFALKYLEGIIAKQTIEQLSGSTAIIMDTLLNIYQLLRPFFNNNSKNWSNNLNNCAANLIKNCDDILFLGINAKMQQQKISSAIDKLNETLTTIIYNDIPKINNEDKIQYDTEEFSDGTNCFKFIPKSLSTKPLSCKDSNDSDENSNLLPDKTICTSSPNLFKKKKNMNFELSKNENNLLTPLDYIVTQIPVSNSDNPPPLPPKKIGNFVPYICERDFINVNKIQTLISSCCNQNLTSYNFCSSSSDCDYNCNCFQYSLDRDTSQLSLDLCYKIAEVSFDDDSGFNSCICQDSWCSSSFSLQDMSEPQCLCLTSSFVLPSKANKCNFQNDIILTKNLHYSESFYESVKENLKLNNHIDDSYEQKPPIPPKQKPIVEYMQLFQKHDYKEYSSISNYIDPVEKADAFVKDISFTPEKISCQSVLQKKSKSQPLCTLSERFISYILIISSMTYSSAVLDILDVKHLLNLKEGTSHSEIYSGSTDVLIVHATCQDEKNVLYQEAFLTTYRTFISPEDLIVKLLTRYRSLYKISDKSFQKAARHTFALIVRVIGELIALDLQLGLLTILSNFIFDLISDGRLTLAQAIRHVLLNRITMKYQSAHSLFTHFIDNPNVKNYTLLDFKSENLAEQMTLLDAMLFYCIEIPELLIWVQNQNEEISPNLTRFTEHFNNMSYWARSRILEQNEVRYRERYATKLLKIMKHLRRLNNFNSYLALLSALDSAPIRRLEWQHQFTDTLDDYCQLIDSSSSFRIYRQELADTNPPCIPYIGLILQDLTFVNIGNPDLFSDGNINFSKHWQQFHILQNIKYFQSCQYNFKRNDKILNLFNGFIDHMNDDELWEISESIKPRGGQTKYF